MSNEKREGGEPVGIHRMPLQVSPSEDSERVDDAETEDTQLGQQTGAFLRPTRIVTTPKQMCTVLRVTSGDDMLRVIRLEPGGVVVVGRDPEAGLSLSDVSVSRRHALVRNVDECVHVEDMRSTNGTFVNGEQVFAPVLVSFGDRIDVGSVILRLERVSEGELAHLVRVVAHLDTARQDPLTGLLTRRWLQDDLPAHAQRAIDAQQVLSAIFLDIDHFKSVNDTFGHPVGDAVIKVVARFIAVSIRGTDFGVRFGGEEFLVVLTGCDLDGALATAERIRKRVATHPWSEEGLGTRAITLSAGVGVRASDESIESWINRTDQALLRAKRSGRNRTLTAGPKSLRNDGQTIPGE